MEIEKLIDIIEVLVALGFFYRANRLIAIDLQSEIFLLRILERSDSPDSDSVRWALRRCVYTMHKIRSIGIGLICAAVFELMSALV